MSINQNDEKDQKQEQEPVTLEALTGLLATFRDDILKEANKATHAALTKRLKAPDVKPDADIKPDTKPDAKPTAADLRAERLEKQLQEMRAEVTAGKRAALMATLEAKVAKASEGKLPTEYQDLIRREFMQTVTVDEKSMAATFEVDGTTHDNPESAFTEWLGADNRKHYQKAAKVPEVIQPKRPDIFTPRPADGQPLSGADGFAAAVASSGIQLT